MPGGIRPAVQCKQIPDLQKGSTQIREGRSLNALNSIKTNFKLLIFILKASNQFSKHLK